MIEIALSLLMTRGIAADAAEPTMPPGLDRQVLLERGDAPGAYAIPKMLVTRTGAVLVVAQDRAGGDWASPIDPILVRSDDGGATWSAPHVLMREPEGGRRYHLKPTSIVEDARSGRVLVFIVRSPLRNADGEAVHERWFYSNIRETRRLGRAWFLITSDDDGRTWSDPVDVTAMLVVKPHWQEWSPVHTGIQLERGAHAGRLVVPVRAYCPGGDPSEHDLRHQTNGVIFSDDGGETWTPGGRTNPYHGECSAIEREDGAIYLTNRQSGGRPGLRTWSISRDGGLSFDEHGVHEDVPDQHCHAGIARAARPDGRRLLLLSNVPGPKREGLTISGSADDGRTWHALRVLEPGHAAYSDLAVHPGVRGEGPVVICVYETGAATSRRDLAVARFDVGWLLGAGDGGAP